MSFLKQLIWSVLLSAAGIFLAMTKDPQAIIAGVVMCIALSIKFGMMMVQQQEDFLKLSK